MKIDLKNEILRKYLLGILQDEETLQKIDEQLFSNKEFFDELNLIEDEIIEDYADNLLSEAEKNQAEKYFFTVKSRKLKLQIIKGLQKISNEKKK